MSVASKQNKPEVIHLLLTSCGGMVIPGIVQCLRQELDYKFHIVGVDMSESPIGSHFVDKFYVVPPGSDPSYADVLLEISIKEGIHVIVPLSDTEALSLSRNRYRFTSKGIAVAVSSSIAIETASNKGSMLKFLADKGFSVPKFEVIKNLEGLDQAVKNLGYPAYEVALKPTISRGGRGFWLLSNKYQFTDLVFQQRNNKIMPYEVLRQLLSPEDNFPELIVMEYLAGSDFNVDLLCDNGETTYCIPVERLFPQAGPVQVGRTVRDKKVERTCKQIASAFEFDFNINIEVAYRDKSNSGEPQVYEINPRVSAPIAIHHQAGINLLLLGILQALGKTPVKDLRYRSVLMSRCWQEVYS